ncbi:MAG: hypothetical protein HY319_31925 [Armatimonadetes bacterium]|nr:hypothetical protein [Armatimonadota bacterium]
MDEGLIYGRHPVVEAVRAGRPINRMYIMVGARGIPPELFRMAEKAAIPVVRCERRRLDQLARGGNHQGVAAQLGARQFADLQEILERALASGQPPFLLALDGVQDPGNLGALLRSAEGAGVHGVLISSRNSCGLTGAVSRSAAGADQFLPVARVERLDRTLSELSEGGLRVVGA